MDDADRASEAEGVLMKALVDGYHDKKAGYFNPSQTCIWCGEPTPSTEHRFCSRECAEDWQREQEAQERNYGH